MHDEENGRFWRRLIGLKGAGYLTGRSQRESPVQRDMSTVLKIDSFPFVLELEFGLGEVVDRLREGMCEIWCRAIMVRARWFGIPMPMCMASLSVDDGRSSLACKPLKAGLQLPLDVLKFANVLREVMQTVHGCSIIIFLDIFGSALNPSFKL